ncbi:MAG TPA: hypothetical protein VFM02_00395 [Candidatus Paceibacterota bacterium]|nr:hypothetical protein [Candidatus Paceibacterota bacterium]
MNEEPKNPVKPSELADTLKASGIEPIDAPQSFSDALAQEAEKYRKVGESVLSDNSGNTNESTRTERGTKIPSSYEAALRRINPESEPETEETPLSNAERLLKEEIYRWSDRALMAERGGDEQAQEQAELTLEKLNKELLEIKQRREETQEQQSATEAAPEQPTTEENSAEKTVASAPETVQNPQNPESDSQNADVLDEVERKIQTAVAQKQTEVPSPSVPENIPVDEHKQLVQTEENGIESRLNTAEEQGSANKAEQIAPPVIRMRSMPESLDPAQKLALTREGLRDFVVPGENGEAVEFGKLSEGKQQFIIENYRQLALQEVKSQAVDSYRAEKAQVASEAELSGGVLKRLKNMVVNAPKVAKFMKMSMLKGTELARREKELQERIFDGNVSDSEALTEIVRQVAAGPEVEIVDGKTQVQFLTPEMFGITMMPQKEKGKETTPEMAEIRNINRVANAFSRIPAEWKNSEDTSLREKFQAAEAQYNKIRDELTKSIERRGGADQALRTTNQLDMKVQMNQFLNASPDVEQTVLEIQDKNLWWQATKDIMNSKGKYVAAGMIGRTVASAGLGAIASTAALAAAPVTALLVGRWRGKVKGQNEPAERKDLAMAGKGKAAGNIYGVSALKTEGKNPQFISESKEEQRERGIRELAQNFEKSGGAIENIANASGENGLTEKLNVLLEKIKDEKTTDANRNKALGSLSARIKYTRRKLDSGLVNFGTGTDKVKNQYQLLRTLSDAATQEYGININTALEEKLDGYLDARETRIEEAKKVYLKKRMKRGALMGLSFSVAGMLTPEIIHGAERVGEFAAEGAEKAGNAAVAGSEELYHAAAEESGNLSEAATQGSEKLYSAAAGFAKEHVASAAEPASHLSESEEDFMPMHMPQPNLEESVEQNIPPLDPEPANEVGTGGGPYGFQDFSTPHAHENPISASVPEEGRLIQPETSTPAEVVSDTSAPKTAETIMEELSAPHSVAQGDNVWDVIEEKLTHEGLLDGLSEKQKLFVTDLFKDKVTAMNPEELKAIGISGGDPNVIQPGETLHLGKIFQNTPVLQHLIEAHSSHFTDTAAEVHQDTLRETAEQTQTAAADHVQIMSDTPAAPQTISEVVHHTTKETTTENIQEAAQPGKTWLGDKFSSVEKEGETMAQTIESIASQPESAKGVYAFLSEPIHSTNGSTSLGIIQQKLEKLDFFDALSKEQQHFLIEESDTKLHEFAPEKLQAMGFSSGNADIIREKDTLQLGELFRNAPHLDHAIDEAFPNTESVPAEDGIDPDEASMAIAGGAAAATFAAAKAEKIPEDKDWSNALFGGEEKKLEENSGNTPNTAETEPVKTRPEGAREKQPTEEDSFKIADFTPGKMESASLIQTLEDNSLWKILKGEKIQNILAKTPDADRAIYLENPVPKGSDLESVGDTLRQFGGILKQSLEQNKDITLETFISTIRANNTSGTEAVLELPNEDEKDTVTSGINRITSETEAKNNPPQNTEAIQTETPKASGVEMNAKKTEQPKIILSTNIEKAESDMERAEDFANKIKGIPAERIRFASGWAPGNLIPNPSKDPLIVTFRSQGQNLRSTLEELEKAGLEIQKEETVESYLKRAETTEATKQIMESMLYPETKKAFEEDSKQGLPLAA